jgi:hypothetical protein
MSNGNPLEPWSQFPSGAVVSVRCDRWIGQKGVVVEKLDDEITGYARYGVRLEDPIGSDRFVVTDFSRCQLKRVRVGNGPRRRAKRVRIAQ